MFGKSARLLLLLIFFVQNGQAASLACADVFLSPPVRYADPNKIISEEGPVLHQYAIDQYKSVDVFEAQFKIANILRTQPELVGLDLLYIIGKYPMIESLVPHETMRIGQLIALERLKSQKFLNSKKVAETASKILSQNAMSKTSQSQKNAYEAQNDLSIVFLTEPAVLSDKMIKLLAQTEPILSPLRNKAIELAHNLARWRLMIESGAQK